MNRKVEHIGTLIGRIFIAASPDSVKSWSGDKGVIGNVTDYELLESFLSYEEGDLTFMAKTPELKYYLYFSMSNKIELFKYDDGIIICDGLYFNKSWNYSNEMIFNVRTRTNEDFIVENETVYVFDAAIEGESVLLNSTVSNTQQESILIEMPSGKYCIFRVDIIILFDEEEVLLKGVMISNNSNK